MALRALCPDTFAPQLGFEALPLLGLPRRPAPEHRLPSVHGRVCVGKTQVVCVAAVDCFCTIAYCRLTRREEAGS